MVRRQQFPGNMIPAGRFDPVAVNVLRYLPLPNVPGADVTNNYFVSTTDPYDTHGMVVKIDHRFSDRRQVSGRFSLHAIIDPPAQILPDEIAVAQRSRIFDFSGRNMAFEYKLIASPSFLVDFRYGFARQRQDFSPLSVGFDPVAELGLPSYIRDIPRANGEALVLEQFI